MDYKPYIVKYKGVGRYKETIKPGIHGRFSDEIEARSGVTEARGFFEKHYGPDAAKVGIVVDQEMLARASKVEEIPDEDDEPEEDEVEKLRKENAELKELLKCAE